MYEYGECINRFIENLTNGSIFETEQVARAVAKKYGIELHHAKSVTNNQLKRLTDAGHIDRIQKGVYYKTPNTVFGKVLPNLEAYAIQLLTIQNQQRIGYVTGATFMNQPNNPDTKADRDCVQPVPPYTPGRMSCASKASTCTD